MHNDIVQELKTNFIEYAVAVNTDRSIPDAKSGMKPVAKRIIWGAYDTGRTSSKPHVKAARIIGDVMGMYHPHGDSSIYNALVRLSQDWVMRYPLIDFHGNNGNITGDGPAHMRYTEARLSKITEEGLLGGIKKNNVDFIPNYDETTEEPVTLPAIFPNLLCNPNEGIGVAISSKWAPHNLGEVAQAIYDYIDGKEPMLPGPDFPTGGIVINKDDVPSIMRTGRGSIKIQGKYTIDKNKIIFYEIPYGQSVENLITEIGECCDSEKIEGIADIHDETNKKGIRIVIECKKDANIATVINKIYAHTNMRTSFSYNQVALIDKTPTELNLKQCIEIYLKHNLECLNREYQFDLNKALNRLEIVEGLLIALANIDDIIKIIKTSDNSNTAKAKLMEKYKFTDNQAKAILNMRLSSLAKLEGVEIENEKKELQNKIASFKEILSNEDKQIEIIRNRLQDLVNKFGDPRRTELTQITIEKEAKEIQNVAPEEVVVVVTENGYIKRVPKTAFKTQKRGGKGIKTQDDISKWVFKTNTIDTLMVFTSLGQMYRLLVNDIPEGNNTTKGAPLGTLISFENNEQIMAVTSLYRNTDAKYVMFITKNGIVKKTSLEEYDKTRKKNGVKAITLREGDSLASVTFLNQEDIIILSKQGMSIRIDSNTIGASSRISQGVIGINLKENDEVLTLLPIHKDTDKLAIFTKQGLGKQTLLSEFPKQQRAGRGVGCIKFANDSDELAGGLMLEDNDIVLVCGKTKSLCIASSDISAQGRATIGNKIITDNTIVSVSKV